MIDEMPPINIRDLLGYKTDNVTTNLTNVNNIGYIVCEQDADNTESNPVAFALQAKDKLSLSYTHCYKHYTDTNERLLYPSESSLSNNFWNNIEVVDNGNNAKVVR